MLQKLYIQNIAVIQKATIDFEPGLNVFTGETGAGKTMLISAIDAVLGERTSREIIRSGEEKAYVSALFDDVSQSARQKLEELGYDAQDGTVLIAREITASGKSACKIGGMPATAAILKDVASLLIHIHGQRDSNQLLLSENHIGLLDLFGNLDGELKAYREEYSRMKDIEQKLAEINLDEAQKAQRIDMLSYQLREIEEAGLSDPDEEESLSERRGIIRNSEKILAGLSAGYEALTGDGELEGINGLMDTLAEGVGTAAGFIAPLAEMSERLTEISYELAEYAGDIRSYLDDFEFDPRELDRIEQRLDTIYKLKRKYGASIPEILEYGEKIAAELEEIETSGERAQKLEAELETAKAKALAAAKNVTERRLDAATRFTALVEEEVRFLDMPSVTLSAAHKEKPMSPNGMDEIEFLISTNVGEPPKPLSKIASGGEIARIMLSIKNVLADRDGIDTLIFDEVDTGVSGRAAQKIGRKLKQASSSRQVIAVTHLAQVAAFADNHLLISKEVEDGRTFTRVKNLGHEEIITELARISAGEIITDLSRESARELWRGSGHNEE